MSQKYTGGFITKSPVAPTSSAASGIWTLDQQQQAQKAGTWPSPPMFIEDLFSTYLYTGTGVAQTITNNVDISGKGGAVWIKGRNAAEPHVLVDSARGASNALRPNSTAASINDAGRVSAFTSSGFTVGTDGETNGSGTTYASWTFREQPKFFDIVTYTGNGSGAGNIINHNLGSTPGFIICKATSTTGPWAVCARTGGAASPESGITYATGLSLNATGAAIYSGTLGAFPTSTTFDATGIFDNGGNYPNVNGVTYVAYLFAHNAGGFPVSGGGSTNGISCGSYTTNGSGVASVTLGYEPQWILWKRSDSTSDWYIFDTMRGWTGDPNNSSAGLRPNLSNAENSLSGYAINSTGFNVTAGAASATYIYIAIRRGPMKVPTSGTSVFTPVQNSNFTAGVVIPGQPTVDVSWSKGTGNNQMRIFDRLRGSSVSSNRTLYPDSTSAEADEAYWALDQQNGVRITQTLGTIPYVNYFFSRAPSYFDEVCYTGTGSATTQTHNLGVVPEMMIVKRRDTAGYNWNVYLSTLGASSGLWLNDTTGELTGVAYWNSTSPTSSVFSIGSNVQVNASGGTYVTYLFATCAGVSKVGSYTGTGALQTVNCGFAAGARFILIKRTDSTGDWFIWDSARGISSGNDPYILLNSAAAQVTGTNYVDTDTTGFKVTAAAPAEINASGGTYLFLAIA